MTAALNMIKAFSTTCTISIVTTATSNVFLAVFLSWLQQHMLYPIEGVIQAET